MKYTIVLLFLLSLTVIFILSCHKKSTPVNYGIKFDGMWTGINSCDSTVETIVIQSPVNNDNSVYYTGKVDTGFCSRPVVFYGTAYGNNITFPSALYTDSCGNGFTVSQSGTIVGVTLILTRITKGTMNDTCIFTATK